MKLMQQWTSLGVGDLANLAAALKATLTLPAVLLLDGPLGAGKTALAQHFAPELTSPTYSLIQEAGSVAHADLFRIKDAEELIHLEIPLYLEGKDLFLVEWGTPWQAALARLVEGPYHFYRLQISLTADAQKRDYQLSSIDDELA
ncbi:MAG: tRNA (adenosine(37)-N6)-threonylcarbamoyltransferase complex ATPase subunit type 1 TsaE [Bacteriovoracaceae bacterium]|nr:tRNA (adenosine(37)-N6)-threonylcarbamoyltransferase complex ATPase subunit type 1 TsaE [Bacteriovoracaceae bacterium]